MKKRSPSVNAFLGNAKEVIDQLEILVQSKILAFSISDGYAQLISGMDELIRQDFNGMEFESFDHFLAYAYNWLPEYKPREEHPVTVVAQILNFAKALAETRQGRNCTKEQLQSFERWIQALEAIETIVLMVDGLGDAVDDPNKLWDINNRLATGYKLMMAVNA